MLLSVFLLVQWRSIPLLWSGFVLCRQDVSSFSSTIIINIYFVSDKKIKSLVGSLYKLLAKVLANRLKKVMSKVISKFLMFVYSQ